MKIEVTCFQCQALLRVSAEHAGKQLRCPACQSLCQIPKSSTDTHGDEHVEIVPSVQADAPKPEIEPPELPPKAEAPTRTYIGPKTAPLTRHQRVPDPSSPYAAPYRREFENGDIGRSFLCFGLGVASWIFCGCFAVVLSPVLFSRGMGYAKSSNRSDSALAFYLNVAGFAIWALAMLAFVFGAIIG